MTTRMETILRPFAAREITPPKRVLTAYATENQDRARFEIGKDGSGKIFSGSSSITITVYMDTKLKEEPRRSF